MANLSLRSINKIYPNNVQAVFDFNMEINDKEFVVFVGPSGCGKSTTLRMVAGLETITSGELYIDGLLVNNVEPKDRSIAMVFQSYALYPHMTTYKNIQFALKLRKLPMTIYEENPEVESLKEEAKEIRRDIKIVDRKFKKNQNSDDLVKEHLDLYKKLYEIDDQIKSLLVPIKGIDVIGIKHTEAAIVKLERSLSKNKKILVQAENYLNHLKSLPTPETEKKIKKLEKDVKTMQNAVLIYSSAIKQNEEQIEKNIKQLDFLKNNEVNLYKVRRLTNDEMDIEVNKAAETLDLTKYLFRKPAALSGGQRQRVALGRCIVRKPKVFLMDEPLSNLDAKLRVQTRAEILNIHERVGATTIYVTHDQTEAMTMADRIVVMKSGVVQQIGTPSEVYNNPANKFVAGFIGSPSMNFINVTYKKGKIYFDESKCLDVSKYEISLKAYEGKRIILGIRPENVAISKGKDSFKTNCKLFELLGFDAMVYCEIFGQKVILKTNAENQYSIGDELSIELNPDKFYFFEEESGSRIY